VFGWQVSEQESQGKEGWLAPRSLVSIENEKWKMTNGKSFISHLPFAITAESGGKPPFLTLRSFDFPELHHLHASLSLDY
jgi:hypothetical protein